MRTNCETTELYVNSLSLSHRNVFFCQDQHSERFATKSSVDDMRHGIGRLGFDQLVDVTRNPHGFGGRFGRNNPTPVLACLSLSTGLSEETSCQC